MVFPLGCTLPALFFFFFFSQEMKVNHMASGWKPVYQKYPLSILEGIFKQASV